jgi:hypothetical protein
MINDYVPMRNLPTNVVCYVRNKMPDHFDPDKARLTPMLESLIRKVSTDRPMWKFVGNYRYSYDGGIHEVTVHDGDEQIGTVTFNGKKFFITSRAIRASLTRGRDRSTAKEAKAYKYITEEMSKMSIAELFDKAESKIRMDMSEACEMETHEFRNMLRRVAIDNFGTFVMSCNPNTATLLSIIGIDQAQIDKMQEGAKTNAYMQTFVNGQGDYVLIKDNMYIARAKDNTSVKTHPSVYNTDTLPARLKRGVGLLKLVDKSGFIDGVGYKVDDTMYFVLDNKQENV